jgi:hypothetical protein
MGDDWRRIDKETDYPELMARKLLIEFIGRRAGPNAPRSVRVFAAEYFDEWFKPHCRELAH